MKTAVLCLLGLCLEGICLTQRPANVDDFRAFYRGAQLVGSTGGVYAKPASLPDTNRTTLFLPFVRPPFYALLLKPLTALPYATARLIWLAIIVAAFAGAVALFPGPRDRLAAALCFSLPVVYTLMLGQDIALVILIVFAAGRLASRQREFSAGMMAGLLAIKPTYLLPVGIVFLARSRRGTCGLIVSTAVQMAISFLIEGPRWPFAWLKLLRDPLFDPEPRRMLNVRSVVSGLGLPAFLAVLASIALLGWLWRLSRRAGLWDALLVALPLGMLASPHSYIYDAVVIVPLLVRTVTQDFRRNLAGAVALTPLPYVALMLDKAPLLLAGSATVVIATLAATAASTLNRPQSFDAAGAEGAQASGLLSTS